VLPEEVGLWTEVITFLVPTVIWRLTGSVSMVVLKTCVLIATPFS
jgi:hypothetical protein